MISFLHTVLFLLTTAPAGGPPGAAQHVAALASQFAPSTASPQGQDPARRRRPPVVVTGTTSFEPSPGFFGFKVLGSGFKIDRFDSRASCKVEIQVNFSDFNNGQDSWSTPVRYDVIRNTSWAKELYVVYSGTSFAEVARSVRTRVINPDGTASKWNISLVVMPKDIQWRTTGR